jgi:tetrapyrrole methylase family protein/MazG family protein
VVVAVGLGPAGPDLVSTAALEVLQRARRCLVRTAHHPAVEVVARCASGAVDYLDWAYVQTDRIDDTYRVIRDQVVAAACDGGDGFVAYVVPGSPVVAERTVALLREDPRVTVDVVPAVSFVDLAWSRLGVDPVATGVRLVDGAAFAAAAAADRGPLLVAQCDSRRVLSEIKLAADDVGGQDPGRRAVILHHLGLPGEKIVDVAWADLDRSLEPDHLTSVWVPCLAVPVAAELARLEELVRTLRMRCPWDRRQTHGSLARHLLEEAYETIDAIEAVAATEPDAPAPAVAHLEEELGDLLFQVYFHALLATEEGRFTLADVARTVHDKLVRRHPHVFGDAVAATPEDVAARWEVIKKQEKGRASVTEGIPHALPALALAAKLQRKADALGLDTGSLPARRDQITEALVTLVGSPGAETTQRGRAQSTGEILEASAATVRTMGEVLFAAADAARRLGVDPESALRARAGEFRSVLEQAERQA